MRFGYIQIQDKLYNSKISLENENLKKMQLQASSFCSHIADMQKMQHKKMANKLLTALMSHIS